MRTLTRLVQKAYRLMLACYPAAFRAEFGPEMYAVFYTKLCEAQRKRMITVWKLLWRELRGWPGSVLQEHLRERMNKMGTQVSYNGSKPLSGFDWLAASVIFILPLIGSVIPRIAIGYDLPNWTGYFLLSIFLGSVNFALVLAVFRGLPRWSLSYFGFFLTILTFYTIGLGLWGLLIVPPWMLIFGPRDSWSLPISLLYNGLMVAFMWFIVLLVAIIFFNLLRHWPRIHALWQHIREDWTHLSFLVYGGLVFYIWLIFDEYRYEDSWIFGAFACLAIGAWLYLRAKGQNMRTLHALASEWYEQQGLIDESIEHALQSKNYDLATQMINEHIEERWRQGKLGMLLRWLEKLPEEYINNSPNLCIYLAWNLFTKGDQEKAEHILQFIEKKLNVHSDFPPEKPLEKRKTSAQLFEKKVRGRVATIRAVMATYRNDASESMRFARLAQELLPADDLNWRSTATMALADAYVFMGEYDRAHQARFESINICKVAGNTFYDGDFVKGRTVRRS